MRVGFLVRATARVARHAAGASVAGRAYGSTSSTAAPTSGPAASSGPSSSGHPAHARVRTQDIVYQGDDEAFARIAWARNACRKFSPQPISDERLARILALTQRAPSGFNLQPYRVVLVRNAARRAALAECFLGGNVEKVRTAPVTAVFLADLEAMRSIDRLVKLEHRAGRPDAYVTHLPASAAVFAPGSMGLGRSAQDLKRVAASMASMVTAVPTVNSAEAWAFKHTMLAAGWYMLGAASMGVSTCPMEGFDAARIRRTLRIPDRFEIPTAVATGYALEGLMRAPRFPRKEVVFEDSFGQDLSPGLEAEEHWGDPFPPDPVTP